MTRLKENTAKFFKLAHFAIEKAVNSVFWIDADANILHANEIAVKIHGYTADELNNLRLTDLNIDYRENNWRELWKRVRAERALIIESRHKTKNGREFPVECTFNFVEFNGEEYSCTFVQDITNRKKSEEKLQKALREVERLKNQLQAENIYLQEEIKTEHNFEEIVTNSEKMKKVLRKIEQVASTDASVLILGETGTGKELIARAVHCLSNRKDRPLVKVNCAALPANLIESELFGHEKGAFTGAIAKKIGRFELADGGTIFLDEIGDLPLELQSKLLRVLQEGEFERLGNSVTIKVDVRIIAATNRNLEDAIKEGRFREDLYYRLNVFPLRIPSLRERKEDIPLLIEHFVNKASAKLGKNIKKVHKKTIDALINYSWPGNIRELENVIERTVIISNGTTLEDVELPKLKFSAGGKDNDNINSNTRLEDIEREHITRVLTDCNWIIEGSRGASLKLGLPPTTLRDRMKKLGIKKPGK